MTSVAEPALSILVATRDRAPLLVQLLRSLEVAQSVAATACEILIADNGSTDDTAAVLERWVAGAPGHMRLRVDTPGKSRALNAALQHARAPVLAFLDDDEQVAPAWMQELMAFCSAHPEYDAAIGRVLPPPDLTDPEVLSRLAAYRTVAFCDYGDAVCEAETLYGGNMVLRRQVFERIGTFDERLGPGAAGGCEDTDLAERIRQAGLRIGYMPRVIVYHVVDPARLTPEAFRSLQLRAARSRIAMDARRAGRRALPRLIEAALGFAWWSLLGRSVRRERARGRILLHAETLRLRWRLREHQRLDGPKH
jgi:glycosyltransferase involved in cell wall biosynthesis